MVRSLPFQIALFEPEIPPNTGAIIRLCANTGAKLHLIEPLGFSMDERRLRRAGLDYAEYATVSIHPNWDAFAEAVSGYRLWAFTTHGSTHLHNVQVQHNDVLLFGSEGRGLGADMLARFQPEQRVRLPMLPTSRSMNLANAVSVAVYEGWRQLDFTGGV